MLQEHQQQLAKAVELHKAGRIDAAQQTYLLLRTLYPDNFDVVHLLGLTFLQMRQLTRSIETLQQAVALKPESAMAHSNLGNAYKARGDLDLALKSYDRALSLNPTFLEARFNRGNARQALNDLENALADYEGVVRQQPRLFPALVAKSNVLRQLGKIEAALQAITAAISLNPGFAEAFVNRGNILTELGRYGEAAESLDAAIKLKPGDPDAYYGIGNLQLKRLDFAKALENYDKAISLRPDYFEACSNRGNALNELNRLDEALASYDKAISLKPDYAEAYSNRGNTLTALGRLQEALESHDKAIGLKPDYAEAYSNRGNTLSELDRLDEALASHDRAISLKPDYAEAYSNRGNTLLALGRLQEAVESHDRAIGLKPDYAEAYSNRGNALSELNRLDEALASHDKAISLRPSYAEAHGSRANALSKLGRADEALASYDKAISLAPDYVEAHYNKALLLLAEQRYASGFDLHRWRWKTKEFDSQQLITSLPAWSGQSVERLLLWAEQGIGDEIFYSSMISLIGKEIAVTLSADKRLHGIFGRSFQNVTLIDRAAQKQPVMGGYDAQLAIGDLGQLLKASGEALEQRRYPFLFASPERTQWHLAGNAFLRRKPVCGIAWKSMNKKYGDRKSLTLKDLEPLLKNTGITFVNLQYGDVAAEIDGVARDIGTRVHQAADLDLFNDIDGLLSLIDACDIVLTTSNVTAHLAGALGKKAAVLVPNGKGRIWYWHRQEQSSWYPSLRLFSQSDDWSWQDAIAGSTRWVEDTIR